MTLPVAKHLGSVKIPKEIWLRAKEDFDNKWAKDAMKFDGVINNSISPEGIELIENVCSTFNFEHQDYNTIGFKSVEIHTDDTFTYSDPKRKFPYKLVNAAFLHIVVHGKGVFGYSQDEESWRDDLRIVKKFPFKKGDVFIHAAHKSHNVVVKRGFCITLCCTIPYTRSMRILKNH